MPILEQCVGVPKVSKLGCRPYASQWRGRRWVTEWVFKGHGPLRLYVPRTLEAQVQLPPQSYILETTSHIQIQGFSEGRRVSQRNHYNFPLLDTQGLPPVPSLGAVTLRLPALKT